MVFLYTQHLAVGRHLIPAWTPISNQRAVINIQPIKTHYTKQHLPCPLYEFQNYGTGKSNGKGATVTV